MKPLVNLNREMGLKPETPPEVTLEFLELSPSEVDQRTAAELRKRLNLPKKSSNPEAEPATPIKPYT